MSTPSSASLNQSSSGSTSYLSASSTSRRSSRLISTVAGALHIKRKQGVVVDASVQDRSYNNRTYNHGQMNIAYGNNVVQNIQVGIDPIDVLVLNMNRSRNAEYDMTGKVQRGSCTPKTRQYVLNNLQTWCRQKAALLLCWLSGMPGTGKTTIVYTLCQYLRENGLLGASFFCSRSLSDCQDIQLIFPTIAYQLARNYPVFGRELAHVLRKDPDISGRALSTQLLQLIIEPFKAATEEDNLPSNLVVVLDALDECKSGHSAFLQTLVKYTSQLPFRLLLTSRPDYIIRDTFQTSSSLDAEKFDLHEVEEELVRDDIVTYLQSKLSSRLPPSDMATIGILADHAGSSFILAATIVQMVLDEASDPKERLESVLKALTMGGPNAITKSLDKIYTEILSRVSSAQGTFDSELTNIKNLLFTVICVREPLTKEAIAALWGLDEVVVDRRLRFLRSVIFIPKDRSRPITTFHTSFIDFITDVQRAGSFYCDVTAFHGELATACFRIMNKRLRPNICQTSGLLPNEEVSAETITSHISIGLAYACVHWMQHLEHSNSVKGPDLAEESQVFGSHHLLHWFECLSLLCSLSICERALDILKPALQNENITNLVQETQKFVQLNYDIISYSASETYFSALVWVPVTSQLRSHYAELWRQPHLPKILHGLPADWVKPSRAIKTHSDKVSSIAITKDGNYIISGSDDMTIRMWDIGSHKEKYVFTGHRSTVTAVAISSSGDKLLSSSSDRTVRVWGVGKPEPTIVFRGHSESVMCVSISNDGKLACSGDRRNNILVWNAETAEVVHSVSDTTAWTAATRSLVFMSDNTHVIYASFDMVHIWNVKSGARVRTLNGHQGDVECLAVSLQDAQIITGSSDKTAKIWSTSSGKKIRTLRGHTGPVQSVAFFHDGYRAVSGSEDKTIRVWNTSTGDTIAVLTGHSTVVWSVAVFPDDLRVVSGLGDGTMSVWAVPGGAAKKKRRWAPWLGKAAGSEEDNDPWTGQFMASSHKLLCLLFDEKAYLIDSSTLTEKTAIAVGHVSCIAISPKETHIAAARHTIAVWETATGRKLFTVKGRKHGVMSIAYSHNASRIVTGCIDGHVRVWCAITGKEQLALQRSNIIRSVAFSPDDTQIVASSGDRVITVLKAATGHEHRVFRVDFGVVSAVFSADGSQIIGSTNYTTHVWNIHSDKLVETFDGYKNWTALPNGISYAIEHSSWICRFRDPISPPIRVCWIPPSYRSSSDTHHWKAIAFTSSSGDRILLTNVNSTVVLDLSTA